jgi:hypothetical protein
MVMPGSYNVSLSKFEDGIFTELVSPKPFTCMPLNITSLPSEDKLVLDQFNIKVAELTRAVTGADSYRKELVSKLSYFKKATIETANVPEDLYNKILTAELNLKELNRQLNGDGLRRRYEGASPSSIKDRIDLITYALWSTTAAPTTTFTKSYDDAANKFNDVLVFLKTIDDEIKQVELILEQHGAPFTPGRFPDWRKN